MDKRLKKIYTVISSILIALVVVYFLPFSFKQTREAQFVFGDSSGAVSAGTDAADTSTCTDNMAWSGFGTPGGTNANDTTYVSYAAGNWDLNDITDGVYASNFGFSTSGTIDGIQVEVINWTTAGGGQYEDVILKTAASTRVGADKEASSVAIPTSDPGSTYASWGGSADTWSASLTSTQVNNSGFGVELCYQATANNSTMNVDHVRITITYTPAAASAIIVRQNEIFFD